MVELTNNQKKWITALRSGEYEQTTGVLASSEKNSYCCLGVACELAIKDGVGVVKNTIKSFSILYPTTTYDEAEALLPESVMNWLGMTSPSGDFKTKEGTGTSLTEINDFGKTFEEIANIIEENADQLFKSAE